MKNTRKPGEGGRKPFKGGDKGGPRGNRPGGKPPGGGKFGSKPPAPREKNPAHVTVMGEGERISKIMARAGVASRRDCERMILEGRVTLNGKVLESPAVNCTPADVILVDGEQIGSIERTRLWIYYKPAGLVTTNYDPEGRPTVFDNLPEELPRVISVGRLDINTEGLLLLTNDGGLARMLELPTTGWLRRYRVRAHGSIDQARLDELKDGIAVDGIFYGSIEATLDREQGHNVWITIGLREGKNREVKNVLGALGLDVNRLIRVSYGPFQLGELEEGSVVEIKSRTLRDQLGPRLIEEANANFEAPIHNQPKPEKEDAAESWERQERPRRESREERRERDLARIDTKRPDFGDRPPRDRNKDRDRNRDGDRKGGPRGRDRDDDRKKRPPLGTTRTANVWMAPGARPVAAKKAKAEVADDTGARRKVLRLRKDGDNAAETPARERPARASRPERAERPERGERPERRERSERNAGKPAGKRPFAKREGDRPEGGHGRGPHPFSDKPRGDKREGGDRPPRSFGGKPGAEGARSERPRGDGPRKGGPGGKGPGGKGPGGNAPRGKGPGGAGGKGMRSGADRRR